MKRFARASLVTVFAAVLLGVVCLTVNSFANDGGGSTSTDGTLAGQCGDYWDTCYGAVWKKYDVSYSKSGSVDSLNGGNDIYVHTQGNAGGGHLYNCADRGAESYYRLGLYVYRAGRYVAVGDQAGLVQVYKIYNKTGGSGTFNLVNFNDAKSSYAWEDVMADFELAKQATADSAYPITDNWSDVSMFCWSEVWRSAASKFESYSQVNGGGSHVVTPADGEDRLEVTTDEETFTATFFHSISYISGINVDQNVTLPTVSTDYTVATPTITGGTITSTSPSGVQTGTYTVDNPRTNSNSGALGNTTVTFTIPEGGTAEVCQKISYNPKNVKIEAHNGNYRIASATEQGSSRVCISVTRSEEEEPVTESDGFWAESKVTVPQQNDVPGYSSDIVTTKDGGAHTKATIKLSTDATSLNVIFTHQMFYGDKLWNCALYPSGKHGPCASTVSFADIKANYKITTTGDASMATITGTYGTQSGDSTGKLGTDLQVTITGLQPGVTKKVCQTFWHNKKSVTVKQTESDTWVNPCAPLGSCGYWRHDSWSYTEQSYTGEGTTELCVEVTRPVEPSGSGPFASGAGNGNLMYAGETSQIGWDTQAEPSLVRRLSNFRAITYLVPASVSYSLNNVTGNLGKLYPNRTNIDPCSWYNSRGGTQCGVINNRQQTWNPGTNQSHTYHESQSIAVPNQVGYKYCTSFGYQWEYWYSIGYDGSDNWQKESSKDYWTNYNAVCRTIAKKPSVAFWNGGVLSNGGIVTSSSPRILGAITPQTIASPYDYDLNFGSWSEYLVSTATGGIENFASGAALARGNVSTDTVYNLSPLTIANRSSIGNSGIVTSSTLRTRLDTYLKNGSGGPVSTSFASGANLTGTHIYSVSGTLNISSNITIARGPYANIYNIPQVLIFVDGDVNISENVTEIDAWIIATGSIDTCKQRNNDRNIQTLAADGYRNSTVCDNPLTINGPVIANSVKLNRSYGSDPINQGQRYTTAEVFNLTPATYLWAYAQAGRYASSYTESYTRELAPRY